MSVPPRTKICKLVDRNKHCIVGMYTEMRETPTNYLGTLPRSSISPPHPFFFSRLQYYASRKRTFPRRHMWHVVIFYLSQ